MTYQELIKGGTNIAMTERIQVVEKDGISYKLFDKSFTKNEIYYEAMLHSLAENSGLPVPRLRGVQEIDERIAILTDYIDGKTILQLIEEEPNKLDYYIDLFCSVHIAFLSKTISDVKKLKHRLMKEISSAPIICDIKKFELQMKLASMNEYNNFCHGNLNLDNVMLDTHGDIYVLDWVAASRGNACADVAAAYLNLTLISGEIAGKYLRCYSEKTNTPIDYVNEWLPVVAAAQLNKKHLGKEEKAILLAWLDVAESE